jgi:HEAT repeat protein
MAHKLSPRAQRHLARRERGPYVEDLELVRTALERAGVSPTEAALDFHHTFAGYPVFVWGEVGPLGIIHREVQKQSWYKPMEIGGYPKSGYLACADVHLSWEMMIQTDGTFHCNGPEASSYFLWTETEAFINEFIETRSARRMSLDAASDELNDLLVPKLASGRVEELSDQYQQLYVADRWAVLVGHSGDRHDIWIVGDQVPPKLKAFVGDGKPKPLSELRRDLDSSYSSRRYKALCQIYETTDPAAGPLFLAVAHDPNERICLSAISGIARLRFADAIPSLTRTVREDSRESVVTVAIMALAEIGGPEVFPALIHATRSPVPHHRRDAAIALGRIGDRGVLSALEEMRGDKEKVQQWTVLCPSNLTDPVSRHVKSAIKAIKSRS